MIIKKRITFAMPKRALNEYPRKNAGVEIQLNDMKFTPSRLAQRLLTFNDWMKKTGQGNQQEAPAKPPEPEAEPPEPKAKQPEPEAEVEVEYLEDGFEVAGFKALPRPKPAVQPPKPKVQPPPPQPPRLGERAPEYTGPWRRAEEPEDDDEEEVPFIEESDPEADYKEIKGLDYGAEQHPEEVIRLRRKRQKYNRKTKHSDSESEDSV